MKGSLPDNYLSYVHGTGVDAAATEGDPGYFQLWALDEVAQLNDSYSVDDNAPGFLGFGSDGGGEMLAFDGSGAVFMIPFVGMSVRYAKKIASSWQEVAARIKSENDA